MSYEIKQGDALTRLREMPDESVQCCVTSPPYFGLRSYGTEPQVWGNHNGCDHVWKDERTARMNLAGGQNSEKQKAKGKDNWQQFVDYSDRATYSAFCLSCNAWRGELGLEPTFQLYISHLIEIFAEVKRVLKKDGTCFVNLGDSYNGQKVGNTEIYKHPNLANNTNHRKELQTSLREKSLMNIPSRFAIAMTDELQMIQRNELIWHKPACMPSSAKDRWTVDFEPIYFFAKSPKYKFNQRLEAYTKPLDRWGGEELVATQSEGWHTGTGQPIYRDRNMRPNPEGRNARTIMTVNFEPQSDEHYASYPTKLVEPLILAGTNEGDTVLDIFAGTGTTLLTALRHRRNALGIELQPKYVEIAKRRLAEVQVNLF